MHAHVRGLDFTRPSGRPDEHPSSWCWCKREAGAGSYCLSALSLILIAPTHAAFIRCVQRLNLVCVMCVRVCIMYVYGCMFECESFIMMHTHTDIYINNSEHNKQITGLIHLRPQKVSKQSRKDKQLNKVFSLPGSLEGANMSPLSSFKSCMELFSHHKSKV